MAEKILIRNTQSPGDYVVLTAAIRDIKRTYPKNFEFYIDVPQPDIFRHNPNLGGSGGKMRKVVAKYPLIHQSNSKKVHFLWGFLDNLNEQLGTKAVLQDFRPDVHLTPDEMKEPPGGIQKPYWLFVSGGKNDYTAKWWDPIWWQEVVNQMKGWTTLVQVGSGSHVHPKINGAIDLVNKTSFRELMRLVYHAEGVLCIVTCLMHLAAGFNRPCVTIAGGREPWWWEGYTTENRLLNMQRGIPNWAPPANDTFIPHRYMHTMGQLDCCRTIGCWKSKIGTTGSVCTQQIQQHGRALPKCMQLITPEMVLQNVEWYYQNGILSRTQAPKVVLPPVVPVLDKVDKLDKKTVELGFAVYLDAVLSADALHGSFAGLDNTLIVLDGCGAELAPRMREKGYAVLHLPEQVGRFQALKQAKALLNSKYTVWIEPPFLPADGWVNLLKQKLSKFGAVGRIYRRSLDTAQAELLTRSTIYRGRPLETCPIDTAQRRVYYPKAGFFALPSDLIPAGGVQDQDMQLVLGEAVRQSGKQWKDLGALLAG